MVSESGDLNNTNKQTVKQEKKLKISKKAAAALGISFARALHEHSAVMFREKVYAARGGILDAHNVIGDTIEGYEARNTYFKSFREELDLLEPLSFTPRTLS